MKGRADPMRILCVSNYYKPAHAYGGPARSVPALCEAMVRRGARVTVFTTNANGPGRVLDVPADRCLDVDGVQVRYFPLSRPLAGGGFRSSALAKACAEWVARFDVVYLRASWGQPMLASGRAARRAGVPYVFSPRGSLMNKAMERSRLKKRLYLALGGKAVLDHASAIHCTSEVERRETDRRGLRPPTVVIPNGVDLEPFRRLPPRGALRSALGLGPHDRVSLFVGRLHPIKRLNVVIESFARAVTRAGEMHLLVVGPDEGGEADLRRRIGRLGLDDRVHLLGMRTGRDLVQAYTDADLLVLLSSENFGMAAVEALAAGVPVLLSRDVGVAESVVSAGAGRSVESDLEAIGTEWASMLTGPDRREMGSRGRRLVHECYSWESVAGRMIELLATCSSGKRVA